MNEPAYTRKVTLKHDYILEECFIPAGTVVEIEAFGSIAYRIVSHYPDETLLLFVTEFV